MLVSFSNGEKFEWEQGTAQGNNALRLFLVDLFSRLHVTPYNVADRIWHTLQDKNFADIAGDEKGRMKYWCWLPEGALC